MKKSEDTTPVHFHFCTVQFTPYKDKSLNTSQILRNIINRIRSERKNNKGILLDRHKNRDNEAPRELFMYRAEFKPKSSRILCSLALLRSGPAPMLKPKDTFQLVPLDSSLGTVTEQTHFFIDYSKFPAVICVQYNHHGPRISDIAYYLRHMARDILKEAKATEVYTMMDASIDEALEALKDVLNIDMKLNPKSIAKFDNDIKGNYFTGMSTFGSKMKPRHLKIELMYETQGAGVKSEHLQRSARIMVLDMLRKFKAKPYHIEGFENFQVKYLDKDGNDQLFNLLSGKLEVIKEVDLDTIQSTRDWYDLIKDDFDEIVGTHE